MEYTLFETAWGYCGIVAEQSKVIRFCLPVHTKTSAEKLILEGMEGAIRWKPSLMKTVQAMVGRYFSGQRVDFSNVHIEVKGCTAFSRQVLRACRNIGYGKTVTYERLAHMAGRPKAIRAAASVLAKNPIPLIIPCHRVIRKDGGWGGFSAEGGVATKKRLFRLENGI